MPSDSLTDALRAGAAAPRTGRPAPARSVLVVGGGGALGSAVLERLLGSRRFAPVQVLVTQGLTAAMPGLEPVRVDELRTGGPGPSMPVGTAATDTAIVVFDRERHANGREAAFARPAPAQLPMLAAWLAPRGVQRLVVVLPHAPSSLPESLKTGLANLDEQAVTALGFEHLVFVRSAQPPSTARATRWLQRLADGVLAQMRMMVPASNQPVRAAKVAQFVVELAAQLPRCAPGTRVVPPELVWLAAQWPEPGALVEAWLAGNELPAPPAAGARRRRSR